MKPDRYFDDLFSTDTPLMALLGLRADRRVLSHRYSFGLDMKVVGEDPATGKKTLEEVEDFNYTQIFRTPFSHAGRGPVPMDQADLLWMNREHAQAIQHALFYGRRDKIENGAHTRTFTGGVAFFVEGREVSDLDELLGHAFTDGMKWGEGGTHAGNGQKFGFLPRPWFDQLRERSGAPETAKYVLMAAPVGKARIYWVPIMDGFGRAFLLDMNHVRLAVHEGRRLMTLNVGGQRSAQGEAVELLSDVGLVLNLAGAHSVYKLPS